MRHVKASGDTPLDHLLAVMRDVTADSRERFEAAKAAAPYVHPRLAAVEHTSPEGLMAAVPDQNG